VEEVLEAGAILDIMSASHEMSSGSAINSSDSSGTGGFFRQQNLLQFLVGESVRE
jgi:hypothetical protein